MTRLAATPITAMAPHGVPAQEMTKWFDTNYHYMVPELEKDQHFTLASRKPIEEYQEAKALGYQTRPVLVGPITFLKLAKSKNTGFNTALAARPVAAGLHRSAARTRWSRRGMGPDRRAVSGARPRRDSAAGAASCLCRNRQGRAAAQDHAGNIFWRAGQQSRHRAGVARRGPAPRSRPRARANRRHRQCAGGSRALTWRDRWAQHLAR